MLWPGAVQGAPVNAAGSVLRMREQSKAGARRCAYGGTPSMPRRGAGRQNGRMEDRPALPPEEQDYVREKTQRMVAVAALRKIHRLVSDYKAPIDIGRGMDKRSLPPAASIPEHARRVAGYAALLKVQQLVLEYRKNQALARKAAGRIAMFFAVLIAISAVVFITSPSMLEKLLRMLS